MLSDHDFLRYSRQIMLPMCGESGLKSLARARVAIVGLGGLGSMVAPYLANAGVGSLLLCDGDDISLSNLPRQWLYHQNNVRQPKASTMAKKLRVMNKDTKVVAIEKYVTADNAPQCLSKVDLIIDCSDNIATRQLLNCHAMATNIPLVIGAASGLQAQAVALHPTYCGPATNQGCYHCLYPIEELSNGGCQDAGVLGPVVGMAGCYQAALALRILLADTNIQWSRLWRLDSFNFEQHMLHIIHDPSCPVCGQSAHNLHSTSATSGARSS